MRETVNRPRTPGSDQAVFDAYGWPHDLSDDKIFERLLELNLERAIHTDNLKNTVDVEAAEETEESLTGNE